MSFSGTVWIPVRAAKIPNQYQINDVQKIVDFFLNLGLTYSGLIPSNKHTHDINWFIEINGFLFRNSQGSRAPSLSAGGDSARLPLCCKPSETRGYISR